MIIDFNKWLLIILSLTVFLTLESDSYSQDLGNLNLKNGIKIHGGLNLQLEHYNANGIEPRKEEFSWLVNGNAALEFGGIQVPLSFILSNYQNKFYQPFNQFGISPYYKWVKLHLGYQSLSYSPYTLAGHRMLGAGFDLTPGKFRYGFMYGRLRKLTEIDNSSDINPVFIRPAPTYKRMGMATKIGYGSASNYIDLSYFKGWDDENSLSPGLKDSLQAAENKAIGLSTKVTIKKNLTWKTEIGLSAYTLNKNDAESTSGSNQKEWVKNLMEPFVTNKISSHYYFAGETRIGYQFSIWTTELVYRKISPDYKSMGAYFFQSDLKEIIFANKFRLDSGRLNLNTSIGFQSDNLDEQKSITSKRFIGSVNVSYIPAPRFGVNLNFNNYGITNNPLPTTLNAEPFKQVNNSVVITPFLNWVNSRTARNLNVVFTYQSLSTPESSIGSVADLSTYSFTTGYNHSWIQQGTGVNGMFNYIKSTTPQGDIGSYGFSVGGVAPFLERKLMANASLAYMTNTFDGLSNGHTTRMTIGVTVPVKNRHRFQLIFNYLNNSTTNTLVVQNFSELSTQIIYGLTF